jgi:hypothetical protein
VSAAYVGERTTAQLLYLGGVERARGAPEGRAWRHLFDVVIVHALTDDVTVGAQADAGVEPNDLGTSSWLAGALYGKLALSSSLYAGVMAGAIFWPTEWVASGTATLGYQPFDGASIRLEYRHDHAAADAFFGGDVSGDGGADPYVFNRRAQDTVTLGATAWF